MLIITNADATALLATAGYFGRTWKSKLRECWRTGVYPSWLDASTLQSLRNDPHFGPRGLAEFSFPKEDDSNA